MQIREVLRLQYFHNKLDVVSCYWFKFELITNITFLPNHIHEIIQLATSRFTKEKGRVPFCVF